MSAAIVSSRRDAGGGLALVRLDVDSATARAYTTPGQFVELSTSRGKAFFVLSGPVRAPRWELLVRNAGEAADDLLGAPIGSAFDVSAPIGEGFPLDAAAGQPLVIAVVGSALGVARPIVARRIAGTDARSTHVLVGARTEAGVPLTEELDAWIRAGIDVVLCLSRPDADVAPAATSARRARGYVQDVLAVEHASGRIPPSRVFAAGPEGMVDAMRGMPGSVLELVTNV